LVLSFIIVKFKKPTKYVDVHSVVLTLSSIGIIFVMTLPSVEPETTLMTISNTGNPGTATQQMELVIRTSGRGPSLPPTRFCYPYGHESRKRQKVPYSASIGQDAPKCDKKKAQIAEGKFLYQIELSPDPLSVSVKGDLTI
jgi:hypothetical protein